MDMLDNNYFLSLNNRELSIKNLTVKGTNNSNTELYLNGQSIVTGTKDTKFTFNAPLNPKNHTVFR